MTRSYLLLALLLIPGVPMAAGPGESEMNHCCPIVELRQYTLHPEKRDVLIELFDRDFLESQDALGMKVIGQFRDLGDPGRFVWLRGFQDMASRKEGLTAFYGGPVWKAHREAANATMIDADNVLLLHPARAGSAFSLRGDRPPLGAKEDGGGLVVATIYYLDADAGDGFTDFFERAIKPALSASGASVEATFVTEHSPNNYPKLHVREGENVFVSFSVFPDQGAHDRHLAALAKNPRWTGEIAKELARRVKGHPEVLRLSPTLRSHLRG